MHQSIPPAPSFPPPPPPGYCGAFARLVSLGGGAFAKFSLPEVSNTHAVCYQNIITQIGSSVKDRNKLRRVFRPHPGDLTAQKSLPPGNCHPRKKKMPKPGN